MLELQKRYHDARMKRDKELYERQIKFVDSQIDRLVYDLYGLTEEEEEVKVVEEKGVYLLRHLQKVNLRLIKSFIRCEENEK